MTDNDEWLYDTRPGRERFDGREPTEAEREMLGRMEVRLNGCREPCAVAARPDACVTAEGPWQWVDHGDVTVRFAPKPDGLCSCVHGHRWDRDFGQPFACPRCSVSGSGEPLMRGTDGRDWYAYFDGSQCAWTPVPARIGAAEADARLAEQAIDAVLTVGDVRIPVHQGNVSRGPWSAVAGQPEPTHAERLAAAALRLVRERPRVLDGPGGAVDLPVWTPQGFVPVTVTIQRDAQGRATEWSVEGTTERVLRGEVAPYKPAALFIGRDDEDGA